MGWHEGEVSHTRVLESGVPEILEGCTLGVGENKREDLVRVRREEVVNFLEVILDGATVKQSLYDD